MGRRQEVQDLKDRMNAAETRLNAVDGKDSGKMWYAYTEYRSLEDRLSALEAKAGEGKGCACKCRCQTATGELSIDGKVVGTVSMTFTIDPIPSKVFELRRKPKTQPGDRIKLRDVPVGRWVRFDAPPDQMPWAELDYKCKGVQSNGLILSCRDTWITGTCRLDPVDHTVTLLPEDYQPGEKADELSVVEEVRVQRMGDGAVKMIGCDGKTIGAGMPSETFYVRPSVWSKDQ